MEMKRFDDTHLKQRRTECELPRRRYMNRYAGLDKSYHDECRECACFKNDPMEMLEIDRGLPKSRQGLDEVVGFCLWNRDIPKKLYHTGKEHHPCQLR